MPEEVALYWLYRSNGALPDNHLMVQMMQATMRGAAGLFNRFWSGTKESYPTLDTFQQILRHRGGPAVNNMLLGPGLSGMDPAEHNFSAVLTADEFFQLYNVYGQREQGVINQSRLFLEQGIVLPDLLRTLSVMDHIGALAVKQPLSSVTLVTLLSDGMAISPSMELDEARLVLVGSTHGPLGCAQLADKEARAAKCQSLNTSMLEYHVATLATDEHSRQFDMPIACYGCGSGGGLAVAKARHEDLMPGLKACTRCVEKAIETGAPVVCTITCPWKACTLATNGAGVICERCREVGVTSANPIQRPCEQCILLLSKGPEQGGLSGGQCVCKRLHPLFLASDCESREMSLMKWLAEMPGQPFSAPDAVHLLKSVRGGVFWWWCILDGHLVCLRLLMVLRRSADAHMHAAMMKAVRAATLRNRDKMSFETVLDLLSFSLLEALPAKAPVVVTLFPETWTKLVRDCPPSAVGSLWASCAHPSGSAIFVTDVAKRAVFMVELHCPVRLTLVAGGGEAAAGTTGFGRAAGFGSPAGIVLRRMDVRGKFRTFLFVCDRGRGEIRSIDVSPLFNHGTGIVSGDSDIDGFFEQATEPTDGETTAPKRNKLALATNVEIKCIDDLTALTQPTTICAATAELEDTAGLHDDYTEERLYVSDAVNGAIVQIDLQNMTTAADARAAFVGKARLVCKLPQGAQVMAMCFDALSRLLLVGDAGERGCCIHVVHPLSRQVTASLPMHGPVYGLDVRTRDPSASSTERELVIAIWPHKLATAAVRVRDGEGRSSRAAQAGHPVPQFELGALTPILADAAGAHGEVVGVQHDDLAHLATTAQPRGVTCVGRSVIFLDHTKGVRLLTDVGPLRRILKIFAPLAAAIGFMPGCAALSWADAEVALQQIVREMQAWEDEVRQRTGMSKPGSMNGPQGIISGSVREGIKMLERSVREARIWLRRTTGIDLHEEGVTLERLLELTAERFFANMRTGFDMMPTELAYRRRRWHVLANRLRERYQAAGLHIFAGGANHYPEPPALCSKLGPVLEKLDQKPPRDKRRERVKALQIAEYREEHEDLFDTRAEQVGQKARQATVRGRTMEATGTVPTEQSMHPPAPVESAPSASLQDLFTRGAAATARAGGVRRAVLHLAHKSQTFVACLGRSREPLSVWARDDVLSLIFIARVCEDVFKKAGTDEWEQQACHGRWLVNNDEEDQGVYVLQVAGNDGVVNVPCDAIFAGVQLDELEPGADEGQRWRLPDAEVARLRRLGQEEHEEEAERQLARDEERIAQRTYEPDALHRPSGTTAARANGKRNATVSAFQAEQAARQRRRTQ